MVVAAAQRSQLAQGKALEDDKQLSSYSLSDKAQLMVLRRMMGDALPDPPRAQLIRVPNLKSAKAAPEGQQGVWLVAVVGRLRAHAACQEPLHPQQPPPRNVPKGVEAGLACWLR